MPPVGSANLYFLPVLLVGFPNALSAVPPGGPPFLAPFDSALKVKFWAEPSSRYRRCIMGKKLYCGNLGYNVSSSDLDQMFAAFGTVKSAEVINDRDTGRSKGFGFVEMQSDNEAL